MVDLVKIGNAIKFLRKRSGFTQKDLADRLGISDKAVSKWERGIGLPDISYLSKLSILLDTDTDSLLNGDVVNQQECWNGLLVFRDSDIKADTLIYDKPISSYLISYFLLVGIRKIYIQCSETDKVLFKTEYGDGSKLGVEFVYISTGEEIPFDSKCTNVMAVYGKSFIFGVDQTRFFQRAMADMNVSVVLSLPKESDSEQIRFDENMKVIDSGSSLATQYNYYQIPVAFMPRNKVDSFIKNGYKFRGSHYTELLDRGFVEIQLENFNDILCASQFVKIVQEHCKMHIYCIEEIAWRRGMISRDQLEILAGSKSETDYGRYLLKICESKT